jgi:hypothetical protein
LRFIVGPLGDLDGDGADEMLVYVAEMYPEPNTGGGVVRALIYGAGPATSVGEGVSAGPRLLQVRPNPSRQTIRIALDGTVDGAMLLRIVDVAGRLVREFHPPLGAREVEWDGQDSGGRHLAAGVYFCTLSSGSGGRVTQKLIRID